MPNVERLRALLLRHSERVSDDYVWPGLEEKPLSLKNANKFFLGAIINYHIRNAAWKNAKRLAENDLGDPERLWDYITTTYSQDEWDAKWRDFRVHNLPAAHNRIWRIGSEIVSTYGGDCRRIWDKKNPGAVLRALEGMRCGKQISRMIVGALISYGHIDGTGDVKGDTHVMRVLGSIYNEDLTAERAVRLARKIHPNNPWELDQALYDIGREYCWPRTIHCENCPVSSECETAALAKANK